MNIRAGIAILIALSAFTKTHAFADDAGLSLPEVLDQIDKAQAKLQDVQFSFIVSYEYGGIGRGRGTADSSNKGVLAAPPPTVGKFFFKRPHLLRIDQTKPEAQTIVSDGKHLNIYTPSANQELQGSWLAFLRQAKLPLPLLTFTGDFPSSGWSERYDVLFGGYDDHLYRLDFKPKTPDAQPLTLWISDDTFLPARGELGGGQEITRVEIRNLRQNVNIPNPFFVLRVPKETAIVPL